MSLSVLLLVFLTTAVAAFVIMLGLDRRSDRARVLRERLAVLNRAAERSPSEEVAILRDELLSEIPALDKMLRQFSWSGKLQTLLVQADLKTRPGKYLLVCGCAAGIFGFVAELWTSSPAIGLVAAAFGASVPLFYLYWRRGKRFRHFEELFPEAIDFLARGTRAGLSFSTTLEMISNEIGEPVAGEFRKVFEEQKYGLPIRDALLNMAERMPIIDVKFFVTAVMLQRETGGNLAEILDKLSYVIRERFKILRQVRVYTAQGRLTLGILMALPPLLVAGFTVVSPDFIKPLFNTTAGHWLIVISITLQTVGFMLIRKIINIQV
ncbi:MAG: type II secretion system F family protein [Acidobacteria bacterium]|nr:type II secretion system F family protein [Acidobacteriota bacterium]